LRNMSLEIDLNLYPYLPSFHDSLALLPHRSAAGPLRLSVAPPLCRSVAREVPCSVPHCCRDRSVQSGKRCMQSRDYRAESTD
jgi:hypothetical protein